MALESVYQSIKVKTLNFRKGPWTIIKGTTMVIYRAVLKLSTDNFNQLK